MRPTLRVLFATALMSLSACSGTHESHYDRAAPRAIAAPTNRAADRAPQMNVPGLLGLSIDGIGQRMGPPLPLPAGFVDPTLAGELQRGARLDSAALFRRHGLAMVVSYNYASRQVSDLLLLGEDENELLRRTQLRLGAENYLVLPVFQARHPTQLLGLRVLATTLSQ